MTDDTTATDRLRQLPAEPDDDPFSDTILLDESDIMETRELRRLVDPNYGLSKDDNEN